MKVTSHLENYRVSGKVWHQRQNILFILLFYGVPEGWPATYLVVCLSVDKFI